MTSVIERQAGQYRIGSGLPLTAEQERALVSLLEQPVRIGEMALAGRAEIGVGEVPGYGRVVVKHYCRGGLLRYVVAKQYLRLGAVRPRSEYEMLLDVRKIGVRAPEPIAYAYMGSLLYRGWLFTREIPAEASLASKDVFERFSPESIFEELGNQLRLLIRNKVLHVDLHPGNVLIERNGAVSIVDFDKAYVYRGSEQALREIYLHRWRRAVIKHELPDLCIEMMSVVLRDSRSDSGAKRYA